MRLNEVSPPRDSDRVIHVMSQATEIEQRASDLIGIDQQKFQVKQQLEMILFFRPAKDFGLILTQKSGLIASRLELPFRDYIVCT